MPIAKYWDQVTVDQVKKAYEFCGYPFFTNGDYNVNLFAIRTNENIANTFNDIIGLCYKVSGEWRLFKTDATANDPGLYYRHNPMDRRGAAILIPGYYKSFFCIGPHGKTKYTALRQKESSPGRYWRDNDRDDTLDRKGKVYVEVAYTNLHRATGIDGNTSKLVDKFSAGCAVIASKDKWDTFLEIMQKSRKIYGNSFSYALFNEESFFCRKQEDYEKIIYQGKEI